MAASRLIQAATSVGIAAVASVAFFFGAQIALFNVDVARVEAAAAAAAPDPATRTQWVTVAEPVAPALDKAATLAPWQATPGVAGTARVLVATRTEASPAKRLLEISQALSVAPTDGAGWLAFADATLRLDYGTQHALHAYDMATLTARREGDQMYARALLVVREWERMPDEQRQAAMGGLADLRLRLKEADFNAISGLVAVKKPEVRGEIVEALPAKLRGDKKFQKAIGL